jgi:lipoprotein NlpI
LDSILLLPKLPDSAICKTYNDVGIYHAIVGDYEGALRNFEKYYSFDPKCSIKTKANILCTDYPVVMYLVIARQGATTETFKMIKQ